MATRKLTNIPVNTLIRNANKTGSKNTLTYVRGTCFENTLTKLYDPASDRELWLIGTTNNSTTLAARTRNLIKEIQPDHLLVQTSKEWAERVSNVDVKNQAELTALNGDFKDLIFDNKAQNNFRGLYFKFNFWAFLGVTQSYLQFPSSFHPFYPGIEIKWAIDAAKELGTKIEYQGVEFKDVTMIGLENDTTVHPLNTILNIFKMRKEDRIRLELQAQSKLLALREQEGYAESIDTAQAYWWTRLFEKINPGAKRVMVDLKDEAIFLRLFRNKDAKKMVAVVNQWHVPGIEARWRVVTETIKNTDPINPIGDMDINSLLESGLEKELMDRIYCLKTKSEPATSQKYITQYTDTTHEHERARHAFFQGASDPHLNHALYNEENKNVEYLSEEMRGEHHH